MGIEAAATCMEEAKVAEMPPSDVQAHGGMKLLSRVRQCLTYELLHMCMSACCNMSIA